MQVAASWPEVPDAPTSQAAAADTQHTHEEVLASPQHPLPADSASSLPSEPLLDLDVAAEVRQPGRSVPASPKDGHSTLEVTPHDPILDVQGDEGAIQEGHEYGLEAVEYERKRQVNAGCDSRTWVGKDV